MSICTQILLKINKLFPPVVHPFNLQAQGQKSYAQWQYEKGKDTIDFYLKNYTAEQMFKDKNVLDIGCGAAGKSLYYASLGAKSVTGLDIVSYYEQEANVLAKLYNLSDKFSFVLGDASALPFNDNSFDTIIINDAVEHVDKPELVLTECIRVLKKGGRIYLNFPPYHHPFGAHLSDAINIPWVHLFFSDATLIDAYKSLVNGLADGDKRIAFRIAKDKNGKEYFSYINKMTIKRFNKIIKALSVKTAYYSEEPLRNKLSHLAHIPLFKELFVKMVVCVIEKG